MKILVFNLEIRKNNGHQIAHLFFGLAANFMKFTIWKQISRDFMKLTFFNPAFMQFMISDAKIS